MTNHKEEISKLEAEMKLLRWHKLANQSALQTALIRTRQMRRQDDAMRPVTVKAERRLHKERIQSAIQDELAKPLQVDKEFIDKYEKEEARNKMILSQQIERRLQALQNVKGSIEKRQISKSRNDECKSIQSYVKERKRAFELEKKKRKNMYKCDLKTKRPNSNTSKKIIPKKEKINKSKSFITEVDNGEQDGGNLPTIIRSLDQLVELESRIKSLEENNVYDYLQLDGAANDQSILKSLPSMKEKNSSVNRVSSLLSSSVSRNSLSTKLSFSKRRTEPRPQNPSRPYFTATAMSNLNGTNKNPALFEHVHRNKGKRPNTVGAHLKGVKTLTQRCIEKKGNTSITRSPVKKSRASSGKENLNTSNRRCIQNKSSKIQIKKTNHGSYLGLKTSNPHLHEFYKIRQDHAKRKEMMQKQISTVLVSSRRSQIGIQKGRQKRVKSGKSARGTNECSYKSRLLDKNVRKGISIQKQRKTTKQVQLPTLMNNSINNKSQSLRANSVNMNSKKGRLPSILRSNHCIRNSRRIGTSTRKTNPTTSMMKHVKIKGDNASTFSLN